MERGAGGREKLRKERSATLHLMQRMGVDTSDWERVNTLCRDPRIAGKDFRRIADDEHPGLRARLRAIGRKGGFRGQPGRQEAPPTISRDNDRHSQSGRTGISAHDTNHKNKETIWNR